MIRIRQGNDFHVAWRITRGGVPENLANVTNIKLERTTFGTTTEHTLYVINGDTVTVEIPAEIQTYIGQYKLTLSYELFDAGMSDYDRKCKVAVYAFAIVDPLGPADDLSVVDITSDVSIGFKGDQGLTAYQVWLENGNVGTEDDYFAYLKQPATDAATSISELEGEVATAETGRNTAEGNRATAEGIRIINEETRQTQEETRQTNTATAISNANEAAGLANTKAGEANTAAQTANTAAQAADTARLNIQSDLATKLQSITYSEIEYNEV